MRMVPGKRAGIRQIPTDVTVISLFINIQISRNKFWFVCMNGYSFEAYKFIYLKFDIRKKVSEFLSTVP